MVAAVVVVAVVVIAERVRVRGVRRAVAATEGNIVVVVGEEPVLPRTGYVERRWATLAVAPHTPGSALAAQVALLVSPLGR